MKRIAGGVGNGAAFSMPMREDETMEVKDWFDIRGKRALVSGSTRGLGYSLARGLLQAGCTVVLNGRAEEQLADAVRRLRAEGGNVHGARFDVCDEPAVSQEVQRIEETIGPIDILVNNAGIQIRRPLEDFALEEWQAVININLTGVFVLSRAVARRMIGRQRGKIVNICSVQSELARPTIGPYTASKGGVRNLTRAMAAEWGASNIQVNGIAPGYFRTDMTAALQNNAEFDAWLKARTPAGRWGEPEELIGALVFLSSKASDFVNGHLLFVDGGLVARI